MQEPHQRPTSFKANTFSRFAKKHRIDITIEPIDPYGLIDSEALKEAKHFAAMLRKGDRAYSFAIVFDDYRTVLPSVEAVLEYLANEVVIYERFGTNAEALAEAADIPIQQAMNMIAAVHATAPELKALLGPEAYADFITITEEL